MRSFFALVVFALFSAAATYTVRPGDTLGIIARHTGVSVAALASTNHIKDPNRVYAGTVLTIPGTSTPVAVAKHVVARGETLGAIAKHVHSTVAALAKANGIANPNRLRVGQVLVVPARGGRAATWVCPVAGGARFYDDFGEPRGGGRRHQGNDLLAPRGRAVVAPIGGVLTRHTNPRGGRSFYLHGDDGLTYYGAHLDRYLRGDGRIRIGEIIGTVGNSGNAAGGPTHLHFEIINHRGSKDPYPRLVGACPRR